MAIIVASQALRGTVWVRGMSFVPYREARKARRRPLDRQRIVSAALELLDDVGLEAITMRRLAERLGVKAASLYRHVRDKDELLVLLADEVSGTIPLVSPEGPWKERLTEMARNFRRAVAAHRDAARLLASTAPFGPRRLRHIEVALRLLRSAGLSPRDAANAAYHLNNFVTEFAADEARYAEAARVSGSRAKMLAVARKHFRSLPVGEFPTIVELADHLTEDDAEGLFQLGLDVWTQGVERLAHKGPLAAGGHG